MDDDKSEKKGLKSLSFRKKKRGKAVMKECHAMFPMERHSSLDFTHNVHCQPK